MKQRYEILYIIPGQFADNEIGEVMARVDAMIEKVGAKIVKTEQLGRQKLAYAIETVRHGVYVLEYIDCAPEDINTLDRELQLSSDVLRHQIVVPLPGAEDKKFVLHPYVAPLSEDHKREAGSRERRAPSSGVAAAGAPVTPAVSAPSLSIEELDKKLDEMLTDDEKSV